VVPRQVQHALEHRIHINARLCLYWRGQLKGLNSHNKAGLGALCWEGGEGQDAGKVCPLWRLPLRRGRRGAAGGSSHRPLQAGRSNSETTSESTQVRT